MKADNPSEGRRKVEALTCMSAFRVGDRKGQCGVKEFARPWGGDGDDCLFGLYVTAGVGLLYG